MIADLRKRLEERAAELEAELEALRGAVTELDALDPAGELEAARQRVAELEAELEGMLGDAEEALKEVAELERRIEAERPRQDARFHGIVQWSDGPRELYHAAQLSRALREVRMRMGRPVDGESK